MTLAEHFTRPVEIHLLGRAWRLVFTYRVLLSCEELLRDLAGISAVGFRRVVWLLLQRAGSNTSLLDVGGAVKRIEAAVIHAAVLDAFRASLPDPKEEGPAGGEDINFLETWAIARHALRLTDDEWLDMTPRQLAALQVQRMHSLQREELLMGILAAAITNSGMARPKKPIKPEDFMLHPFERKSQSMGEALLNKLRNLPPGAAKEEKAL